MSALEPLVVSVNEALRLTNLSRTSLYAAIANGNLAIRKAGRRTLIETAELRRFINSLPTSTNE